MKTAFFTFGSGQIGEGKHVKITAPNATICRAIMHLHYGNKWCMMYDSFDELHELDRTQLGEFKEEWKLVEQSNCYKKYIIQSDLEPMALHVVKSGKTNEFIVTEDTPYDTTTEVLNLETIKELHGIEWTDIKPKKI